MTIRPIENPDTGYWQILEWTPSGKTFPLPMNLHVEISSQDGPRDFGRTAKQRANDLTYMVAEQLGSMGFIVHIELLDEDK